jgi:hypothetical protein
MTHADPEERGEITVRPVRDRMDHKAFINLPWTIYAGDPQWRAPLKRSVTRRMNTKANPFHAEAAIDHFVAYRRTNGVETAVGRVSVTVDPDYTARYGRYAFFGFFESTDDARVAGALLSTAEQWARQHGMAVLTGPYNYSTREEIGLLVDGFDEPPTLMQPHNPRYYPRLLNQAGYVTRFDTTCYRWRRGTDDDHAERLRRRARKVLASGTVSVRSPDVRCYEAELELLRNIYNDSFHDHPEHVPVSAPVFSSMAKELRRILDPDLIRIIDVDGSAAGFLMMIPDLNQVVPRSGRLTAPLLARLLLKRDGHIPGIDTAVVVMIGAAQSRFGAGIGRVIAGEITDIIAASRYRQVATTWVHQDNRWSKALVAQMNSQPTKRYRVYEKAVA